MSLAPFSLCWSSLTSLHVLCRSVYWGGYYPTPAEFDSVFSFPPSFSLALCHAHCFFVYVSFVCDDILLVSGRILQCDLSVCLVSIFSCSLAPPFEVLIDIGSLSRSTHNCFFVNHFCVFVRITPLAYALCGFRCLWGLYLVYTLRSTILLASSTEISLWLIALPGTILSYSCLFCMAVLWWTVLRYQVFWNVPASPYQVLCILSFLAYPFCGAPIGLGSIGNVHRDM